MEIVTLRAPMTETADTAAGQLSGTVLPYGAVFHRQGIPMVFAGPGSVTVPDDIGTVKLLIEHDHERPIGYGKGFSDTSAGLFMAFSLADHDRSRAAADELSARLRDGFSVGVTLSAETVAAVMEWAPDSPPVELSGTVREVSLVAVPEFNDARATRTAAETVTLARPIGDIAMTVPAVDTAAASFTISETPEYVELANRLAALEMGGPAGVHAAAAFDSLGDAIRAGTGRDAMAAVTLALADNTTENGKNAGVVPPAWLTSVVGVINRRRAAVNAFGGPGSLPADGLTIDWPYYDGDMSTLVGQQTAQKTEITSAAVDIKRATADILTFAGGADNALQLIERSSPAFLSEWGRIMAAAYAMVTENHFAGRVAAGAGGSLPVDFGTASAADIREWLFEASDMVDDATGAPAEFMLAAPDVFVALGKLDGLYSPEYGTNNAAGVASAATLRIDVNGLPVIKTRGLAAGVGIVANSDAARFHESGPRFIDALNVSQLGRDSAIYGYGVSRITVAAGIVKSATPPA
jgi:phage head maturation protease